MAATRAPHRYIKIDRLARQQLLDATATGAGPFVVTHPVKIDRPAQPAPAGIANPRRRPPVAVVAAVLAVCLLGGCDGQLGSTDNTRTGRPATAAHDTPQPERR